MVSYGRRQISLRLDVSIWDIICYTALTTKPSARQESVSTKTKIVTPVVPVSLIAIEGLYGGMFIDHVFLDFAYSHSEKRYHFPKMTSNLIQSKSYSKRTWSDSSMCSFFH